MDTSSTQLPRSVPMVVAAHIYGLSPALFKKILIDTGRVATEGGRVVLASLAHHWGRPITAKQYLHANISREAKREWQREYAARKRAEQRRPA